MKFLKGEEARNFMGDLVYDKKQVHKYTVDLTVRKLYEVSGDAKLDFGGGEYSTAEKQILKPELKNPDDDYGWWHLKKGYYLLKYNERLTIAPGQKAILMPHDRLNEAGATHDTKILLSPGEIKGNLAVHTDLSIKENARISKLIIIEGQV